MPKDSIWSVMANLTLERVKTYIPYPLYIGMLGVIFGLPIFFVSALFSKETTGVPSSVLFAILLNALKISLISGLGITTLFGILWIIGKLSGYSPFIYEWKKMNNDEAEAIENRIKQDVESLGFKIYWQRSGEGFIAVRGMELEQNMKFHSGIKFPIRVFYTLQKQKNGDINAKLKLETRTVTLWDTGESKLLQEIGNSLVQREVFTRNSSRANNIL